MGANNIELLVRSLTQINGSLIVKNFLNVVTDNGILLDGEGNNITVASFVNNKKGHIKLVNNKDLTLENAVNKAEGGSININNKGSVTAKNGLSSKGIALVWSDGDIDIQKDSNSKEWMGLYANNGGIKTKSLNVGSINLSASKNGLTAEDITSDDYIIADVGEGDISVGNLSAAKGETRLITQNGKVTANSIKADKSVSVVAHNGDLRVDTIQSRLGYVEAIGDNALTANSIVAGTDFYVSSLGDVNINSLYAREVDGGINSDLLERYKFEDNTSHLIGKNLNIESIYAQNNFDSYADENYIVNNIQVGKEAKLEANNDIIVDKIRSGEGFTATSLVNGNIKINEVYSENGDVDIFNEIGDIELKKVDAGGDIHFRKNGAGDIFIIDSLNTRNNGSLYTNINNGDFIVNSGKIDGEASIYSENGSVYLSEFNVNDSLDVRAKGGNVVVYEDIHIGENGTLVSDSKSVILANAEVGGDLNISAKNLAQIDDAFVGGSMLMKGLDGGCYADDLVVGTDLILNTNTGDIKVENATVGEDSYISIDESNGGNIEINKIKTGKDFVGDLIVTSRSEPIEDEQINIVPFIKINDAVAANRLIINSFSKVILNTAYALNGNLEVLSAGDVVAELIRAAKETIIATFNGIIYVSKVISGDSLTIIALAGKIGLDDVSTLNPDADITIGGAITELSIANASTTRDIKFFTILGDVHIDTVHAGNDIIIDGVVGSNVEINNTVVDHDVKISGGIGNINLANTYVGNDLSAELDGTLNFNDVTVGNNTSVNTKNNSVVNLDKFGSKVFNLTDKGQSSLYVSKSQINEADIELGSDAKLTDSNITNINADIAGDLTVNKLVNTNSDLDVKGCAEVVNMTSSVVKAVVGGNTKIADSSIVNLDAELKGDADISNLTNSEMKAVLNGNSSIASSKLGNADLTNKGEAVIKDSTINSMTASNDGELELTTTPVESLVLTNNSSGIASIHDTTVNSMTASNDGELSLNSVTGNNMELTSKGNVEAVNGDIIIGQINGKTLVFKQDTNDRTLRIREANVETTVTAGADYIDIDMINQTAADDRLGIDFTRVNGRAMDNVIIRDVRTDTGVNMFNLVSTYATIHVSNEIFNLKQTYLLKKGDLSNTSLKFRLFGDNPKYSKEPDIIAFFAPRINRKNFADISFTNIWHPGSQDYYPLIAKGDYKRMFNQYTVVQDFETMRLAYEERIDDLHDDVYTKFDHRKINNSKAFYVDYGDEVLTDGENVNLEDVDIPVGVEFDSAGGELKAVGSQVKPQRAID